MTADPIDLASRRQPEPRHLYGVTEISRMLGVNKNWLHQQINGDSGAPPPDFRAGRGGKTMLLWTAVSVDRWRAFCASELAIPNVERFTSFSDHNAFNRIAGGGKGGLLITWKLWWQTCYDGGTLWWFSTPQGWYTSTDDGRTWTDTGLQVRPGDYHYFPVNGRVAPAGHVTRILRSAEKLRQRLARETEEQC